MKKAIVYASGTGNTKYLAEALHKTLGDDVYCGDVAGAPQDADVVYVGFWTMGFSCPPPIKDYLASLSGKKIFLFGTAGYGSTPSFYENILKAVKEHVKDTNEIIGEFMCQGKVSDAKKEAIKKMDEAKFESMKSDIDKAENHPDDGDRNALIQAVSQ